jgi:hypothetical protein
MTKMMSLAEAAKLIQDGQYLYIAATENCLTQLPLGNWIGGTIPYFMTPTGGMVSHDQALVTVLPQQITRCAIMSYNEAKLSSIPKNYFSNGLSLIIIPAFSQVHLKYAKECTTWSGIFNQPLVGWITGIDLTKGTDIPKVINGMTGELSTEKALVMHLDFSTDIVVSANIINIFEQDKTKDSITFKNTGFETDTALINGKEVQLGQYLEDNAVDLKRPLVADYMGAMINVSFRDIDPQTKKVRFYAPVFPDVTYKLAKPFDNYEKQFEQALKSHQIKDPLFACNCILNFLYANLEGKTIGNITSPMTFGEIAYMLLNQTFVYISLEKKKS